MDTPVYSSNSGTSADKYKLMKVSDWREKSLPQYKVVARRSIGSHARAGDIGGYVSSYDNLSQHGDCWIAKEARVIDNARVYDNAYVDDSAEIAGAATVSGSAIVSGYAIVEHGAIVTDNAKVGDDSHVKGASRVINRAVVQDRAVIADHAIVAGDSVISDDAHIREHGTVYSHAQIGGKNVVAGMARIEGILTADSRLSITGKAYLTPDNKFIALDHEIWNIPDNHTHFEHIYELELLHDQTYNNDIYNTNIHATSSRSAIPTLPADNQTAAKRCGHPTSKGTPCKHKVLPGVAQCAALHPQQ